MVDPIGYWPTKFLWLDALPNPFVRWQGWVAGSATPNALVTQGTRLCCRDLNAYPVTKCAVESDSEELSRTFSFTTFRRDGLSSYPSWHRSLLTYCRLLHLCQPCLTRLAGFASHPGVDDFLIAIAVPAESNSSCHVVEPLPLVSA